MVIAVYQLCNDAQRHVVGKSLCAYSIIVDQAERVIRCLRGKTLGTHLLYVYEYPCFYGCGVHASTVVPRPSSLHRKRPGNEATVECETCI